MPLFLPSEMTARSISSCSMVGLAHYPCCARQAAISGNFTELWVIVLPVRRCFACRKILREVSFHKTRTRYPLGEIFGGVTVTMIAPGSLFGEMELGPTTDAAGC